ncbi:MAG: SURF1 family cytochrome oxidase biogenesis protein [Pseudomonadota bacterium]|nr:SURF1 family cytochrome oxidase biogenesis protein [Pseudomonadota bacterium]
MRRSRRARLAFLALFGLGGIAVLCWLGTWQVQRLQWKLGLIEALETRVGAEPGPLAEAPAVAGVEYQGGGVGGAGWCGGCMGWGGFSWRWRGGSAPRRSRCPRRRQRPGTNTCG